MQFAGDDMSHWLRQKLRENSIFVADGDDATWSTVVKARPRNGKELHAKLVELCLMLPTNVDWSLVGQWAQSSWNRVAETMRFFDTCPFCHFEQCEADWVDNGVALVQCGPFHCDQCGAVEMGPEMRDESKLTEEERNAGWYKADNASMTCAPTVGGVLVGNHQVAQALYEAGLLDPFKEVAPSPVQVANDDIDWNKVDADDFVPLF